MGNLNSSCRPLGPIFHGPMILLNILYAILRISIILRILFQYDTMSDLIILLGQCDIYFMVQ